jgi:hypothetical protein
MYPEPRIASTSKWMHVVVSFVVITGKLHRPLEAGF